MYPITTHVIPRVKLRGRPKRSWRAVQVAGADAGRGMALFRPGHLVIGTRPRGKVPASDKVVCFGLPSPLNQG